MASATGRVDELVKDYLLFRGLTNSLRTFETELKNDKEKGLRVDKIVEQLISYVTNYDLSNLREYWMYLNHRLFSRLEQRCMVSVRKLEVSLLKMFVVNAQHTNHPDKVMEFFEKMTPELYNQPEFREWFTFPFIANPQENSIFAMYFSKQWQDTLVLSLHNFLSVILQAMPVPTLLNFEHDYRRMKLLQEENESLKKQIMVITQQQNVDQIIQKEAKDREIAHNQPSELVYDFSGLSEENTVLDKQPKSRRFPLSLSSPLTSKKKPNKPEQKITKHKVAQTVYQAPAISKSQTQKTKQGPVPASKSASSIPVSSEDTKSGQKQRLTAVEIEKQRRELLGDAKRFSDKTGRQECELSVKDTSINCQLLLKPTPVVHSVTSTTTSDKQKFDNSSPTKMTMFESHKVKTEAAELSSTPFVARVNNIPDGNCPFLLLSQEEYGEHHSAISYCKFSMSGQYISSLDVDGIVKVWSWSPQPATIATVMSKSAFLSLDWASKSDRWVLFRILYKI